MNERKTTNVPQAEPVTPSAEHPTRLKTDPRIAQPDEMHQTLLEAYRGLSDQEARKFTAKLFLILANHIGDIEVVRQAVALAGPTGSAPQKQ